ncbi:MAG: hypothetical protein ACQKBU_09940, partial [Verrucomicrobiales bacterium]
MALFVNAGSSTLRQPSRSKADLLEQIAPVVDWIDRELVDSCQTFDVFAGNTLLDLRRVFMSNGLNRIVGGFDRLLPRLEQKHFLVSFRSRRWLAWNFEVRVADPLERVP